MSFNILIAILFPIHQCLHKFSHSSTASTWLKPQRLMMSFKEIDALIRCKVNGVLYHLWGYVMQETVIRVVLIHLPLCRMSFGLRDLRHALSYQRGGGRLTCVCHLIFYTNRTILVLIEDLVSLQAQQIIHWQVVVGILGLDLRICVIIINK